MKTHAQKRPDIDPDITIASKFKPEIRTVMYEVHKSKTPVQTVYVQSTRAAYEEEYTEEAQTHIRACKQQIADTLNIEFDKQTEKHIELCFMEKNGAIIYIHSGPFSNQQYQVILTEEDQHDSDIYIIKYTYDDPPEPYDQIKPSAKQFIQEITTEARNGYVHPFYRFVTDNCNMPSKPAPKISFSTLHNTRQSTQKQQWLFQHNEIQHSFSDLYSTKKTQPESEQPLLDNKEKNTDMKNNQIIPIRTRWAQTVIHKRSKSERHIRSQDWDNIPLMEAS